MGEGWKIARGSDAVNVYDPTGRRVLSIRETGSGVVVVTHKRGIVPLEVVADAMTLATVPPA